MAKINLTEGAQRALRDAIAEHHDAPLHLAIDEHFDHQLYFEPRTPNDEDVYCGGGVTLVVDAISAQRADGLTIDFIDQGELRGFKIDNPNAPPKVKPLPPSQLFAMITAQQALELIDVRTEHERAIAQLPSSRLLDPDYAEELLTRDKNATLVFLCHHGVRSRGAAEYFVERGFRNVYNLSGGIDAWSLVCDPSLPRY